MATTPFVEGLPQNSVLPPRPSRGLSRYVGYVLALAVIALTVYSWIHTQGSITSFFDSIFGKNGIFRGIIGPHLPGDWSVGWQGLKASVTTFCVAWLSIILGVVGSVAMLPFAARNLAPNRAVYEFTRAIQAILRAIPELVMLLLFIATIGLTPFSMVCALTFHGMGVKGKLFAEAVEEMDMAPIEALRVAGASRLQVFVHAVLPGVRNTLVGLTLYRLDGNFRSAVTLGVVGGIGIGFLINNQVEDYQYGPLVTYLVIMIVWVLVIERVSTILRQRFAS